MRFSLIRPISPAHKLWAGVLLLGVLAVSAFVLLPTASSLAAETGAETGRKPERINIEQPPPPVVGANKNSYRMVYKGPGKPPAVMPPAAGNPANAAPPAAPPAAGPKGSRAPAGILTGSVVTENEPSAENPLRYNGGYVQHQPHIYIIFWGKNWNERQGTKEKITTLYQWLNGSPFAAVLKQYFDYGGAISGTTNVAASFADTREDPKNVDEAAVKSEVAYAIEHQAWPTPNYENQYVVFTSPNATLAGGEVGYCGYHDWWGEGYKGTSLALTYIPWPTNGCYEDGATEPWQSLQITASHEWAEAATDPIIYGSYGGWNNTHWVPCPSGYKCSETVFPQIYAVCAEYYCATGEEVADMCFAAQYEASGIWLNRIWDDYLEKASNTGCVLQDASPVRYQVENTSGSALTASHSIAMHGSINPAGYPATYQFQLFQGGELLQETPATPGAVPYNFASVGLDQGSLRVKGNTTYRIRFTSTSLLTTAEERNYYGVTGSFPFSAEATITTPDWRPIVSIKPATRLQPDSAMLNGTVNPQGEATSYQFEYGKTTAYGQSVPVPAGSAGSGSSGVDVSQVVEGLEEQTLYHYRIRATNNEGSVVSGDQTFWTAADRSQWSVEDRSAREQWSYYPGSNGKICMYSYQPQALWNFSCLSGGQQPAAGTVPAAIRDPATGTQWVYYTGSNSRLCIYVSNPGSGWTYSCPEGGQAVAAGTSPSVSRDPSTGNQAIYYTGSNSRLCVDVYHPATGFTYSCPEVGQAVAPGTSPSVMRDPATGNEAVYYTGSNSQICVDVYHPSPGFTANCLASGQAVAAGTSPSVIRDPSNGQEWIYYTGSNSRVCLYAYNPGPGFTSYCPEAGPSTGSGASPSVVRDGANNQWIYYRSATANLCLLYFAAESGSWTSNCPAGGEAVSSGRPPAIIRDNNGDQAIYYQGANARVCLYAFNGNAGTWGHECPEGGKAVAAGSKPAVVSATGEHWVYYGSSEAHLCRYKFALAYGAWSSECAPGGQALAAGTSPAATRDSASGEQWSYYTSNDSRVCFYAWNPVAQWSNRCLEGGQAVGSASSPAAIRSQSTGEQWVYYNGSNSATCYYSYAPGWDWNHACISGGQVPASGTSPSLLRDAGTGIQWVYYTGSNSRICLHAYNPGSGWTHSCPEGQGASLTASPSAVLDSATGNHTIYYTGSNSRICLDLYRPGSGFTNSCPSGGQSVASGTSPSVIRDQNSGQEWIYYAGSNSRVCLFAYTPGPGFTNYCPTPGQNVASGSSPTALRDASTGEQWIYYRGTSGRMCQLVFTKASEWKSVCREEGLPVG